MKDDNERAILGKLPDDPRSDAKVLDDAPRIVTARAMLRGSVERADDTKRVVACTTGNSFLDEKTGGILPGWCWLLGAPTNWGKTMWSVAVADDNLRAGRGVLIVSLEDPEELYADRLMLRRCCVRSREGKGTIVSADNLRLRRLSPSERIAMRETASLGEEKPLFVDARAWKGERIAKEIGRILDNVPIDLVILDYLQEVQSERQHQSTRDEVRVMARALREAVKSRMRSLIIVSQVTVGEDPDKWPRMNQIRDSRDVVNAAEVVVMGGIAQADIPTSKTDPTPLMMAGERGLRVEKVKQGKKGLVKLPWDDDAACFLPVATCEPPDEYASSYRADDLDAAGGEW